MDWSLPEICGWSLAGNCFILMYCLLNRGNNPSARKAAFLLRCSSLLRRVLGSFVVLKHTCSPLGGKEMSLCTLTPTPQICMHVHAQTRTLTPAVQSSPQCLPSRSPCCVSARGRVSCSSHVHLPNDGHRSVDSGKQPHPPAQPLVGVCFAAAVSVESRVATHVRCPLLVNWQWSNNCIYVPLPLHPKSLIPCGRAWGLFRWKYTSCTCLGLLLSPGPNPRLHWLGSAPKGPAAEQPPHKCLGLFKLSTETTRKAVCQALWGPGTPWGWDHGEAPGGVKAGPVPPPQPGAEQLRQPQPQALAPPCLSWGSPEMLIFELLLWDMEREADFCFSLTCIKHICRVSLVLGAGGAPLALTNTSGALWLLPKLWGRQGSLLLCSEQAYICTEVFEDLCWILIKVSPSLGSSPLMVEKLDPRVADTSRAEGGRQSQAGGSAGGSGEQHKMACFFVLFCFGCLPSSLWAVLCSFQGRYLNCQGRQCSAFALVLAGRSPSVLRETLCHWPA